MVGLVKMEIKCKAMKNTEYNNRIAVSITMVLVLLKIWKNNENKIY